MKQASGTTYTAFEGSRRLAAGRLAEVALAVKRRIDEGSPATMLIFADCNGRSVDVDLRGTESELAARYGAHPAAEPRGRGRPRLGVLAREVTLLPRHWDWLNTQRGGASVALRALVETASRANRDSDARRGRRDAAYHFMSAMAGDLPGFEEASRALFADDRARFLSLIAAWPTDLREHIVALADGARAGEGAEAPTAVATRAAGAAAAGAAS